MVMLNELIERPNDRTPVRSSTVCHRLELPLPLHFNVQNNCNQKIVLDVSIIEALCISIYHLLYYFVLHSGRLAIDICRHHTVTSIVKTFLLVIFELSYKMQCTNYNKFLRSAEDIVEHSDCRTSIIL